LAVRRLTFSFPQPDEAKIKPNAMKTNNAVLDALLDILTSFVLESVLL
jgi:hypothetical protein